MRIALFTETYLPYINGVVTHVRLLREGLIRLGHEVLVVSADPTVHTHTLEGGHLRCPAHTLKRIYGYGVASPVSASRLVHLTRFNPEIIHIHTEFGVGFFGMQAATILGIPMVYTIHTMYDDYLHYVAPSGMTFVLNKTISFYLKQLTRQASALIGPSAKVSELCRRHGVRKKVHLIKNCPDLVAFAPEGADPSKNEALRSRLGIPVTAKVLLSTSRVAKEKSLDVLIAHFAAAFAGDLSYHLIIVGNGPILDDLKQQAAALSVKEQIHFTGSVPNTDIPSYCHISHLFVSASLSEMFSIAMLEALAAGLPAVIRRDELNKGQIEPGVNGFLFEGAEDFAGHVQGFFARTDSERESLVASTRASVSGYGSTEMAEAILRVYLAAQRRYAVRPYARISKTVKSIGHRLHQLRS